MCVWVICGASVTSGFVAEVSVWVICAAAFKYWRLQSRCLCEWSAAPQYYYIGVCRGCVSVSHLLHRSDIVFWSGDVSVSDLWRRIFMGVCRGGVSVSHLWRRSDIGLCRGMCQWVICGVAVCLVFAEEVSVWVICAAAFKFGVCRGGVCVTDLWRRGYFGICRGGVSVN